MPRETVETHAADLAAELDWANDALGRNVFSSPNLPKTGRDAWFGDGRPTIEDHASILLETSRLAQNERALRFYLKACKKCDDPALAIALLDQAWLLTTDRLNLDRISREALDQDRADRERFFAKGRLMRRIETPRPDDPPLLVCNPFDRPWREDTQKGMHHSKAAWIAV